MPKGAKRRKALKRKKEEEKSAIQSSAQIGASDDDPRSQDDKGGSDSGDGGDVSSPTTKKSGNGEESSSSSVFGSGFGGESKAGEAEAVAEAVAVVVKDVVVGEESNPSRDVKVDFVEDVKSLSMLSRSSSSSSSSSSDSSSDEEKKDLEVTESVKEVVVVGQEEERLTFIEDSPLEDSEKRLVVTLVDLGVEEISRNGGDEQHCVHEVESDKNVIESVTVSSLDNLGADPPQGAVHQFEEKSSVIDDSQSRNSEEKTLAVPVIGQGAEESSGIGGEQAKVESETVKSKDSHVHEVESDKNARESDAFVSLDNEQHELPVAPPTIRPTSWKSCCGLFEVLTGSSR
ncbi:hypothetical protein Sjap_026473 [Stephania japonica]|uniref:Uncharacterized protein n=1 Tax=Stephania japonica TaxID=461633 RepID=A0AAP0E731_9MAGN